MLDSVKGSSSLPKSLGVKVAGVARRLGKPQRTVLREATDEYAARHSAEAVTAAMNRVADLIDTRPDPGLTSAARRILERTEW